MTYMKINNYRIRRPSKKKIPIFQTVNKIKKDLKTNLPELTDQSTLRILSSCRRYYEGKLTTGRRGSPQEMKRELTTIEKIVYEYLIRNNYNPSTCYRWFLACRMPEDIKEQVERGNLNIKTAYKMACNRARDTESKESLYLLENIRSSVRAL